MTLITERERCGQLTREGLQPPTPRQRGSLYVRGLGGWGRGGAMQHLTLHYNLMLEPQKNRNPWLLATRLATQTSWRRGNVSTHRH